MLRAGLSKYMYLYMCVWTMHVNVLYLEDYNEASSIRNAVPGMKTKK
jgi:hypothetical protein